MAASNDLIVPPATAQRVAQVPALRATTQVIGLAQLGHLAHEEDPELVSRHLLRNIAPR
jgi:hypothetical protein